jgi:dolichol-phosphate mannosyltransferase
MRYFITIPSYNERENVTRLADEILKASPEYFVCIVDDNSPDGTPREIERYAASLGESERSRFHYIIRSKKDGRGGAVRKGLLYGISSAVSYDAYIEMDADFTHLPSDLPRGIACLADADVAIASRYLGGTISGWPLRRRILSRFANLLARLLIDWRIVDYTSGYRFYSPRAARLITRMPQKHKGFIYLSETIAYCSKAGMRIAGFPFDFIDRAKGQSNAGYREVFDALIAIFMIAGEYHFGRSRIPESDT